MNTSNKISLKKTNSNINYKLSISINAFKFALVFSIVNLHTLRNIIEIPYLIIYAFVVLMTIYDFQKFGKMRVNNNRYLISIIWFFIIVFGFLVSINFISFSGSLNGFIRYSFAFPIFIALINYTDTKKQLTQNIGFAVAYFSIASLTLPLQFITGAIQWFPDSSERAGLTRFSSIIGSLTSMGIIVGCYIVMTEFYKKYQLIFIGMMIVSSIASLSKAAIANVGIGILIVMMLNTKNFIKTAISIFIILVPLYFIYISTDQISSRIDASLQSFGINIGKKGENNYDYTVQESALDRITRLPKENYKFLDKLNTPMVYLTGAGFGMADTALVPKSDSFTIMAHNQYAENITVFGWIFGIVFNMIMLYIGYNLFKKYLLTKNRDYLIFFFAYIIFLINSIFANGTTYQPSSASIFYIAMFLSFSKEIK